MPKLLLIPVTRAAEALRKARQRHGQERDLTDAEVHEFSELLLRCVRLSEVLLTYAKALAGKPSGN